MDKLKTEGFKWWLLLFLGISFLISQSASFFKDVNSDAPIFESMNGMVDWWVRILSYKVQIVWLFSFAIFLGVRKPLLTIKQGLQVGAYAFSTLKDVYDWVDNGNKDTRYVDWTITVALLLAIEFLYDTVKKFIKGSSGNHTT